MAWIVENRRTGYEKRTEPFLTEEMKARLRGMFDVGETQERREPGWQVDPGRYDLLIGRSAADIAHRVEVQIPASGA